MNAALIYVLNYYENNSFTIGRIISQSILAIVSPLSDTTFCVVKSFFVQTLEAGLYLSIMIDDNT